MVDRQAEMADVELFFPFDVGGLDAGMVDARDQGVVRSRRRIGGQGDQLQPVAEWIENIEVVRILGGPVFLVAMHGRPAPLQPGENFIARRRAHPIALMNSGLRQAWIPLALAQRDELAGCGGNQRVMAAARQHVASDRAKAHDAAIEFARRREIGDEQRHMADAGEPDRRLYARAQGCHVTRHS